MISGNIYNQHHRSESTLIELGVFVIAYKVSIADIQKQDENSPQPTLIKASHLVIADLDLCRCLHLAPQRDSNIRGNLYQLYFIYLQPNDF